MYGVFPALTGSAVIAGRDGYDDRRHDDRRHDDRRGALLQLFINFHQVTFILGKLFHKAIQPGFRDVKIQAPDMYIYYI